MAGLSADHGRRGPALAGRTITIWVDETSLHVLLHSVAIPRLMFGINVLRFFSLPVRVRPLPQVCTGLHVPFVEVAGQPFAG
jgi:hypothetical protein